MDKENTYNGNPSLMLVGYNEDKTSTGRAYGERWVSDTLSNISQGNSYEYSAMVQTYAADEGAYLSFIFTDENGHEISTVKSDSIKGSTNAWVSLNGVVTAPAGAKRAAVACNIDGKGTAWIADVAFNSMTDTAPAGISITGANRIVIPASGSSAVSYTVNCISSTGSIIGAADAKIEASNLPSGVSFANGVLHVSRNASGGTVRLSASYMGYTAEYEVVIAESGQSSGGGGNGGTGGGITSGSGGGSPGGGRPMGNVNYGAASGTADLNSGTDNNTSQNQQIPTLLQAPPLNYFTGGDKNRGFTDIDGVPWAKQAIDALYKAGIVNGREEGLFVPDGTVTRAEFAAMLVKTFKLTSDNTENGFADVNDGDWYNEYVNTAVGLGIVNGIRDDYFGADESITRQDIAVLGARLWNSLGRDMSGNNRADFTDFESISAYASDAVYQMAKAGVVNGTETGAFAPHDNATRAEAAVIIYRMAVKYDE